jgi:hypothetical protein
MFLVPRMVSTLYNNALSTIGVTYIEWDYSLHSENFNNLVYLINKEKFKKVIAIIGSK